MSSSVVLWKRTLGSVRLLTSAVSIVAAASTASNATVPNGNYAILAASTGNALDCTGCSNADGTPIQLWSFWGGNCQQWNVNNLGNGFYSIRNLNADGSVGRSLDCSGCSPNNGTQIDLWDYWGGPCQEWTIAPTTGSAYSIASAQAKSDGTFDVLDGSGCSGAAGTSMILWSWDGGGCQQQWVFMPLSTPPAPANLTAVAGTANIALTWAASTWATTYNVKRSTTKGGPYTNIGTASSTSYTDTSAVNGTTYYYVVSGVDGAGEGSNSSEASATIAVAQSSGLVASFLADSITGVSSGGSVSTWIDSSGHGNNATVPSGNTAPTYSPTSMNGKPVVHFNASASSMLTFPRPIQDDFSIVCVWRSTQGMGSGNSFYQGAGLVQGEMPGVVNDFGTSLTAGGAILAGTGAPDTTAVSGGGLNDGNAHILTFERVRATGALSLFVDGAAAGTATGGTQSLTSPTSIGIGATVGGLNYLTGDIAEVDVYNTALSSADRQAEESALKSKWGIGSTSNAYSARFMTLWSDIHNPANGYFSPKGIPYHTPETLIVEAPDYGHETTSETYSYWIWLESVYGGITGDWSKLSSAWSNMQTYMIPSTQDQPTNAGYNAGAPATYAPEGDTPSQYPVSLDPSVSVGADPIAGELASAYGDVDVYGMHWLMDTDNWYGYGVRADGVGTPSFINTFQRGPLESVWKTIPQPSWDALRYGGPNGYLDLFVAGSNSAQWKYTDAPDADARVVQALYWAKVYGDSQGGSSVVNSLTPQAAKLGDYLRYALFDKYFKPVPGNPAGVPYNNAHYLLSWYYAWGGGIGQNWAWRIGSSHAHFGYQNPLAAWVLSSQPAFKPASPNAPRDWNVSLGRQLEFYAWLQSAEGAIAGGATNSWNGRYETPPAGTPTFYGMPYQSSPVYVDPPSNSWFGFQCWSVERVAEYYYATGDSRARTLLDRWVAWATANTTLNSDGTYQFPSTLSWSGAPATWNPSAPVANSGLHVSIVNYTNDPGVGAALAKTLLFYSARSGDAPSKALAKQLLDRSWTLYQDSKGVAAPEVRTDYSQFVDPVYVPAGWNGTMPDGDPINSSATFIGLRSKYRNDPSWPSVQSYLNGGPAPTFTYHRFWAEADIAIANADYALLFPNG